MMSRKTFFSFHYKNDVWRAGIVRNSWLTKPDRQQAGFIDAAEFEKIKAKGAGSVEKWIDEELDGTTVTVVLIGAETSSRDYVKYELQQSFKRGNGIIGLYVHNVADKSGNRSIKGSNEFGLIGRDKNTKGVFLSADYPCYDYINDDGYNNLGRWIETAAIKAGK